MSSGGGTIFLRSFGDITINGLVASSGANVTLVAGMGGFAGGASLYGSTESFALGGVTLNQGINAGSGDILINATAAVRQPSPFTGSGLVTTGAGALTVRTYNTTGAAIDLQNDTPVIGNSVGAGGVVLEARRADSPPLPNGDNFANGNIDFKSISGINLKGVGTAGDITLTAASYNIIPGNVGGFQGNNVVLIANAGNIDVNTPLFNSMIKNGNPGGSLSLKSVGNININQTIGASNTDRFKHALTLTAGNDINVNKSIWLEDDLKLQANATPAQIGAGPVIGNSGKVNLFNAAIETAPLELRAKTIIIGDAIQEVKGLTITVEGGSANADRGVLLRSDTTLAVKTLAGGISMQTGASATPAAAAAIQIKGSIVDLVTTGVLAMTTGAASATGANTGIAVSAASVKINAGGAIVLTSGSAMAAGAKTGIDVAGKNIDVLGGGAFSMIAGDADGVGTRSEIGFVADAGLKVKAAGDATLNAGTAKGVDSDASVNFAGAGIQMEFGKQLFGRAGTASLGGTGPLLAKANLLFNATGANSIVVGGDLVIVGGSAKDSGGSAIARVVSSDDVVKISAGKGVALVAGDQPQNSGVALQAGSRVSVSVNQNGTPLSNFTDLSSIEAGLNPKSNLILVGNGNSNTYNIDNGDLLNGPSPKLFAPNTNPVQFILGQSPISVLGSAGDAVNVILRNTRAEAYVISGVAGIYNPAQPDTPKGILRTYITLQDTNKNKNKNDDNCQ